MLIELCPTGFGQYSILQLDCSSLIGFCVVRFILGGPLCCFRFLVFCGFFQVDLYAVLGFWCSAVYFRQTFMLFQVFVFCSLFQVECLLLQVFLWSGQVRSNFQVDFLVFVLCSVSIFRLIFMLLHIVYCVLRSILRLTLFAATVYVFVNCDPFLD